MQYLIFPAAVLIKRCHDARCDDGGASWGQKVRPGRRTQEAPTNLETPSAVVLFNIFFALAIVNFKKSRKLIGEKHIYIFQHVCDEGIHSSSSSELLWRLLFGGYASWRAARRAGVSKSHKNGVLPKSSYLRFEIL